MPYDFSLCKKPHFLGIGGAGQSPLARLLLRMGLEVTGCDLRDTKVTEELVSEGAVVWIGHEAAHLDRADWLIYTDAASEDHPERREAERRGMPSWRRSQLLGYLMNRCTGVAVTGTHGKTSTCALLGSFLVEAGMDPTIVLGGEVPSLGGSLRIGKGEWFVAEACEAYAAVLDLQPKVAVLLNLESDHLHYHKTFERLVECMSTFVEKLPEDAVLIYPADDPTCLEIARHARCKLASYGLGRGDYRAEDWGWADTGWRFALRACSYRFESLLLSVAGEHNLSNAVAAAAAALECGCPMDAIAKVMERGVLAERRLEEKGTFREVTIIDDYAHHPTEISASLQALRQRYPGRRIIVVFQPHLYSRTRDYLRGFAESLSKCDSLVLTDIYPAREKPIPGVSSARLAEEVTRLRPDLPFAYVPALGDVATVVVPNLREGDVFVAMGAGDVNEVIGEVIALLEAGRASAKSYASKKSALNVLVLAGGFSAEREVSRATGEMVAQALRERGHLVHTFDPISIRQDLANLLIGTQGTTLRKVKEIGSPDVVFVALHGTGGEDGCVQAVLELAGFTYTGSRVLASALAIDKYFTKQLLGAAGVPIVKAVLVRRGAELDSLEGWTLPAAVKPNRQGSSVGLNFAHTEEELRNAVKIALRYDTEAIIEPLVRGVELSACVLGNRDPEVLPLVEIVPKKGAYDYEAKYTPGETEEIVPARVPNEVAAEAASWAARSHDTLGCEGFSRVDMIWSPDYGIQILEVNTVPGMTPTSIFPRAAAAAGISFPELCERIVMLALEAADARRPVL